MGPETKQMVNPKKADPKPRNYHRSPEGSEQLDRRQLMAERGWSSTFLWRLMRLHGLPFRKIGKKLWFIRCEVDAWCLNAPGQKPQS